MTDIESKIISLTKEGWTYGQIQLKLGNPSKKFIRSTLLKYEPELLKELSNTKQRINLIKKYYEY